MPSWLLKSTLQHAIALLPYRQSWNSLFQRFFTKSLHLGPEMVVERLEHCRAHLDSFFDQQPDSSDPFTALELGTGWYPTIPLGLYLCGVDKVWTLDIDPLLNQGRLRQLIKLILQLHGTQRLFAVLPKADLRRLKLLQQALPFLQSEPPEKFLQRFNIQYVVRDAQQTGLPANSIDLFCSSGVLEYIPAPVIRNILLEFRRIATSRAVSSHWIYLLDQFARFDRSITPFNFLKYTSKQWRFLNSPLIWQNRLRVADYRKLFTETGYSILNEINTKASLEDLKKIRLAPEFQHYSQDDLLIETAWLSAKLIGK